MGVIFVFLSKTVKFHVGQDFKMSPNHRYKVIFIPDFYVVIGSTSFKYK